MKVFNLRLPDDLNARLRASAEHERRSLNAEILHRLERSFPTAADYRPRTERSTT